MSLLPVKLSLSKLQARKLVDGKTVQLKQDQFITGGDYEVMVDKKTYNKIKRANKLNRGVRLTLSNDQIAATMTGQGFKSLYEKAKNVGKRFKEQVLAPSGKKLKEASKARAKSFAIEALAQEKPLQFARENVRGRTKEFLQEEALPELRNVAKEGTVFTEKQLEEELISKGLDRNLVESIVTASTIRLDNKSKEALDNLETQLQGMGFIRGVHYTRQGGKISFSKIWRGIKRGFNKFVQPVIKTLDPVIRPIISTGAQALGALGGPVGSKLAETVANEGLDVLSGKGMRKRKSLKGTPEMAQKMAMIRAMKGNKGKGLYPMGRGVGGALYPMGKRGGALYPMGKRGKGISKQDLIKPKSEVTKQNLYVEGGYNPNPQRYTGQYLV